MFGCQSLKLGTFFRDCRGKKEIMAHVTKDQLVKKRSKLTHILCGHGVRDGLKDFETY